MDTTRRIELTDSRMFFVDFFGKWEIGSEVTTVMIDMSKPVAHVFKDYDPNLKRTIYKTYDNEGKELLPPNASLYQVKQQLKRQEPEIIAALEAREIKQSKHLEKRKAKTLKTIRQEKAGKRKEKTLTR